MQPWRALHSYFKNYKNLNYSKLLTGSQTHGLFVLDYNWSECRREGVYLTVWDRWKWMYSLSLSVIHMLLLEYKAPLYLSTSGLRGLNASEQPDHTLSPLIQHGRCEELTSHYQREDHKELRSSSSDPVGHFLPAVIHQSMIKEAWC